MAGWLAYRYWLCYLRRFDPTFVSLQIEKLQSRPEHVARFLRPAQGERDDPAYGSRQMIQTMCGQAESSVAPLDFRGIVNSETLRRLLAISGCVLAGFLVSSVFAHEYYTILMGRMLLRDLAYPTRTRIIDRTEKFAIKQGDPADLTAEAAGEGRFPNGATSDPFENPVTWEELPLTRDPTTAKDAKPTFTYKMPKASQSFAYKFRIGDGRSRKSRSRWCRRLVWSSPW